MSEPLTPRQLECYNAIKAYYEEFCLPPTKSELAEIMNVSPASITGWIEILQRKGYVEYTFGMMRSIRIVKDYQCQNDAETAHVHSSSDEGVSVRTSAGGSIATTTKR